MGFLRIVGTSSALLGLVLGGIAIFLFSRDGAVRSWPEANGVILSSTVDGTWTQAKDGVGRRGPYESCVPKVRYRYTVDGKELEGSTLTREPFATSRGEAEQWVKRYPVGKAVQVHYDPADPTSSVLELKTSVGGVVLGAIGAFFVLFGVAFAMAPRFVKGLR